MPMQKDLFGKQRIRDVSVSPSGIRDNHYRGNISDFLKYKIKDGADLCVVSAYFTFYAYEALKEHLNRIQGTRFLFGEPGSVKSLGPEKTVSA